MIIYHGPSALNGQPIIAIATRNSSNRKTGDLVQVWIMAADVEPHVAVKTGQDDAVCGDCPRRHYYGGDCYVLPFQAPLAIWRAWRRGSYINALPGDFAGDDVRIGAYGDPAAVPVEVWEDFLKDAATVIGYTHQRRHHRLDVRILDWCMVSADTAKEAERAQLDRTPTFRSLGPLENPLPHEVECPSTRGQTCADCRLCRGRSGPRVSIWIRAHGQRSDKKARKILAAVK